MDAVVCHGPGDYRFERIPIPALPAGGAVLRVEAVGICASDVKCFQGAPMFWGDESRAAYCEPPVVSGHEFIGIVEEIDAAAVSRWGVDVGSRVAVEQIVPCGTCLYCRRGSFWLCDPHRIFGFKTSLPGAMGQYVAIPSAAHVYQMAADVRPEHAAFTEPLACALHAVDRAGLLAEDVVVVAGAGPIGLGMVAGAARSGVRLSSRWTPTRSGSKSRPAGGAELTINIATETQSTVSPNSPTATAATSTSRRPVTLQRCRRPADAEEARPFVEYSVFKEPVSADGRSSATARS
jgi:D-arabinose 1-dehydrogenase-like Zn-dependent alcohol dehydrogenase